MRRSLISSLGASATVVALALGPFGAAAAAPYVYGCTPAKLHANNGYTVILSIYNGSGATANLTTKVLTGTGTILNPSVNIPLPLTWTLPATHTRPLLWLSSTGYPLENIFDTVEASVRIVSDVPVAASLSHDISGTDDWRAIDCISLKP